MIYGVSFTTIATEHPECSGSGLGVPVPNRITFVTFEVALLSCARDESARWSRKNADRNNSTNFLIFNSFALFSQFYESNSLR